MLEPLFEEYAQVSGLRLHHGKSVWVPLYPVDLEEERARLSAHAPSWGDFAVSVSATYLGFVIGPGRGSKTWDKAFKKYQERAQIWAAIGGGMALSLAAYRMYILPVLSFLAQLDEIPDTWEDHERRALARLLGPEDGYPLMFSAVSNSSAAPPASRIFARSPTQPKAESSIGRP